MAVQVNQNSTPSGTSPDGSAANPLQVAIGGVVAGDAATGAAAAISAGIGSAPGKTAYLSGFQITGTGATAPSTVTASITGLAITNQVFNIAVPTGAGVPITPIVVRYSPAIPASAPNQAILLNVPSFGAGNLNVAANIQGFLL